MLFIECKYIKNLPIGKYNNRNFNFYYYFFLFIHYLNDRYSLIHFLFRFILVDANLPYYFVAVNLYKFIVVIVFAFIVC